MIQTIVQSGPLAIFTEYQQEESSWQTMECYQFMMALVHFFGDKDNGTLKKNRLLFNNLCKLYFIISDPLRRHIYLFLKFNLFYVYKTLTNR